MNGQTETPVVITETATPATPPAVSKPAPAKFDRAFARRQWRASFADKRAWRHQRQRGEDFSFRNFVAPATA